MVDCQYARAFYLALQFGLGFLSQRPSARVSRSSFLAPVHGCRRADLIALTSFHFERGGGEKIPVHSNPFIYFIVLIVFILSVVLYAVVVFTGNSFMRTIETTDE